MLKFSRKYFSSPPSLSHLRCPQHHNSGSQHVHMCIFLVLRLKCTLKNASSLRLYTLCLPIPTQMFLSILVLFPGTGDWTHSLTYTRQTLSLSYILEPVVWRQHINKLPGLTSDFWPACLSILDSWEYRCAPPRSAPSTQKLLLAFFVFFKIYIYICDYYTAI